MTENVTPTISFKNAKPHYLLLDGLRGVAALIVIWYHVFEGFAFASNGSIDTLNHGYLAVDFFFILSGFVISYAYDDRWHTTLTLKRFFTRRLIRLHPMLIMGAAIGAVSFFIQGSVQWDGTHIATSCVMLALLCSMFLMPAVSDCPYEVRGNGEMFPLNGPSWSLFFEYLGNILYALILRKFSTKALALLVLILGGAHAWFASCNISHYGNIGVGWTMDTINFWGGMLRMLYPFSLGMLLARTFHPIKIRGAFWICSALLIALFFVPYINEQHGIHFNGIYETLCVTAIFPIIVWMGASGSTTDHHSSAICQFLGNISYPVYIIHYPIMYLFYSWLINNKLYTLGETWLVTLAIVFGIIALAYICLRFYDIPIRRLLIKRFHL